jgi:glyoxylase-like metal-dependent hydrolase (beta-lactamase superfamily II)
MRLHLLRLGSLQGDKGQVLTPGSGDGVSILIPVPAYLIETADGRRILVDTGSPRKYILDPDGSIGGTPFTSDIRVVMTERDDPVARLAEMGFAPSDIDIVVATHFHFGPWRRSHRGPTKRVRARGVRLSALQPGTLGSAVFAL